MVEKSTRAWGTASVVIGILSILFVLAPYLGLPLDILAIVFYSIQKKNTPTGPATAGLVTGIIGVIINASIGILFIGALGFMSSIGEFDNNRQTDSPSEIKIIPSTEKIIEEPKIETQAEVTKPVQKTQQQIIDEIKSKCANDWKDDFSMRSYCVDRQIDSFNKLIREIAIGISDFDYVMIKDK